MHVALYQPEIPPNTGNIARLCAGFSVPLHLIKPLGFSLEDKYLKRAGLDYWEFVSLFVWDSYSSFTAKHHSRYVYASSQCGVPLHEYPFSSEDTIILGPETRGIPKDILQEELALAKKEKRRENIVRINTRKEVRSLNLATVTGIILYQALLISSPIKAIH
ncbi:MAG: tRNA (cytidine(34)-2'-O)-methyltransferase [Desulfovibrionaceae bacterium]